MVASTICRHLSVNRFLGFLWGLYQDTAYRYRDISNEHQPEAKILCQVCLAYLACIG